MTDERQLHLGLNVLYDGYHTAAWRAPYAKPFESLDPEYWIGIAQAAERATLDALFLADSPALGSYPVAPGPPLGIDPLVLFATLSSVTERVGFIATASTSFEPPYTLARQIASLDLLSGGRAAWNVVTSADPGVAPSFGTAPHLDREERYRRAQEFVDVVFGLWGAWSEDALVGDQAAGLWADPDRVTPISHHGEYFDVEGALGIPRSPQGRPVIFQAGGSPAGLEFGARNADAIFAAQATLPDALEFAEATRARAAAHGRRPDAVKILPGLTLVVGGTEAEAQERYRELNEIAGPAKLYAFAGQIGVAPEELDLDGPLPERVLAGELSPAAHGARDIVVKLALREQLTVRQLLERVDSWHRQIVGTPEQVADSIEEWFLAGAVDGFNLMPDVGRSGVEAIVDHIVPLLRDKGIFRREYSGTTLREHLDLPPVTDNRTEKAS